MAIEKFLIFWNYNNTLIIEILIAIILGLILLLGYLSFFGKNQSSELSLEGSQFSGIEIQTLIKKLVDSSGNSDSSHSESKTNSGTKTSSGDSQIQTLASEIEVAQLKKSLQDRENELAQIKEQLKESQNSLQSLTAQSQVSSSMDSPSAPSHPTENSNAIPVESNIEDQKKIKELEQRLAEYEIISEDIADISRYKEENEKLKAEIESLKAQLDSFAKVSTSEANSLENSSPVQNPISSEVNINIDDELMREFSEAVNNQKKEQESAQSMENSDSTTGGKESA